MANLPSKMYLVRYKNLDFIAVFSNKKLMFESLMSQNHLRFYSVYNYWSFSQLLKHNPRCLIATETESVIIDQFVPNQLRSKI